MTPRTAAQPARWNRLVSSLAAVTLSLALGNPGTAEDPLFDEHIPSPAPRKAVLRSPTPSAAPETVDGQSFDLVVVGGTPGGVAMAVRAAREGLRVLLVNHTQHLGGMLSNGLGVWDTLHAGRRAPLFDELHDGILTYYRTTYGDASPQYAVARGSRGSFEPKVAEAVVDHLVAGEANIVVLRGWYPTDAKHGGRVLRAVVFRQFDGTRTVSVAARVFADATYEGDLAAVAKVPCRVGREARAEHAEPHAGRIFTRIVATPAPAADEPPLKLRRFGKTQVELPGGSGEGNRAIQAYNFRVVLCNDPANRVMPEKPTGYDPAAFLTVKERWGAGGSALPNRKASWNAPLLIGGNYEYPEADWAKRAEITARHRDFALGLLYFLQNDPSRSAAQRREAREWGLAKDEFVDNGHVPYEMYVREARRIVGRYVFTEHDGLAAPDLCRAPIHTDSIAITEWPLDSHECRTDRVTGSVCEGKVLLSETTRPGQIPYRCLLPQGLDNLLVPMCLSATHIGWGTVRLEPTAMNIGESAGYAAVLAVRGDQTPAAIDVDALQRRLIEGRVMVSFFNDVDLGKPEPWTPAVQYLGTKGFFAGYDARPRAPLTGAVAKAWLETFALLVAGRPFDPTQRARQLTEAAREPDDVVAASVFAEQVAAALRKAGRKAVAAESLLKQCDVKDEKALTRGEACRLLFTAAQ